MTTYYLQKPVNPEYICGFINYNPYIDYNLNKKHELINSCEAESWIEAKQKFNYQLTSLQQLMIKGEYNETMA